MKHLKLIKTGTAEDFLNSDNARFPCICCYDDTHPEYDIDNCVVFSEYKPGEEPINYVSFTIDNKEYTCPAGMTWHDYIISDYNIDNFILCPDCNQILVEYNGPMSYVIFNGTDMPFVLPNLIIEPINYSTNIGEPCMNMHSQCNPNI